ncbi:MAG: anti-sigma factor family protein [Bryobacteraceae bacterium]
MQAKLDSYIDNELLVETNLEMTQHFERCAVCAREASIRRELRSRVRAAAKQTPLPAGLDILVRQRLRHSAQPTRWWLMAIAAVIVVSIGSWLGYERLRLPPAGLVALLGIGQGNHVHCAVGRQNKTRPVGIDKLSPEYKPILAIARQTVPVDMPLAVAHECRYKGRPFIHVTFRNDQRLLSVIVVRKQEGESLLSAGARPAMSRAGIDLYSAGIDQYQGAAFESGGFLVYTMSDLSRRENLRILAALAPAFRNALQQIAS